MRTAFRERPCPRCGQRFKGYTTLCYVCTMIRAEAGPRKDGQ